MHTLEIYILHHNFIWIILNPLIFLRIDSNVKRVISCLVDINPTLCKYM